MVGCQLRFPLNLESDRPARITRIFRDFPSWTLWRPGIHAQTASLLSLMSMLAEPSNGPRRLPSGVARLPKNEHA